VNGSGHLSSIGAVVAHSRYLYGASLDVYVLDCTFCAGVISTYNLDRIALAELSIAFLQLFTQGPA